MKKSILGKLFGREEKKAPTKEELLKKKREEYKEKRTLTVKRIFELGNLEMPQNEALYGMKDFEVQTITVAPERLTSKSVFFFWKDNCINYQNDPLELAKGRKCLLTITDYDFADGGPESPIIKIDGPDSSEKIRDAYISILSYIRDLSEAKVITVTGSVGKTSTKEMIEAVLRARYMKPVIPSGNKNSFQAVGRHIQTLMRKSPVYLQEVGAAKPGVVEMSASILKPDIAVFTNIGQSHIEDYGSHEALISDKLSLARLSSDNSSVVINHEDEILMNYPYPNRCKIVTYSMNNSGADFFAKGISKIEDGHSFTIVKKNGSETETFEAKVHAYGEHNILNACAAFAVGTLMGIDNELILKGIESYRTSGIRQNLVELGGMMVMADCYNSSVIAIDNILSAMDDLEVEGKRIAVLGDITRLGDESEESHTEVGQIVIEHKVDAVLFYGKDMRFALEEIEKVKGFEETDCPEIAEFYSDRNELENRFREIAQPGDLALFKASHAVNIGASLDRLFNTDMNENMATSHKMFTRVTDGDFEYNVFETHATLRKYLGNESRVVVPDHVYAEIQDDFFEKKINRDFPVEVIGKIAFKGLDFVTEVELSDTVRFIRTGAFDGCPARVTGGKNMALTTK